MKRRQFVRRLGGGVVGAGLASATGCALPDPPPGRPARSFQGWTWVHGNDQIGGDEWRRRFGRLRAAGLTSVLVSGGDTGLLSEAARSEGLEFHRWTWILNRNGDARAQAEHPEWFTVSRNGESTLDAPPYVDYYRWVCPTREPVREYLNDLVDGLAADDRVDGVHLDYIRHSDVILPKGLWATYDLVQDREYPEFDFCYCDVCRAAFEQQEGVDPLELDDPPSNDAWVRFRQDSVTRLVTELADTVHARDKPITAAVFPTPVLARRLVRQAWEQWPLDAVFPMLYHSFYEEELPWIGDGVRAGLNAILGARDIQRPAPAALFAGLYLPAIDAIDLRRAVDIARRAGAEGVSFFDSGGLSDAHVEALAGVF